ncbi:MAG: hypothetical protein A2X86_14395 [Bdellovibrionales bacterium GWA2_49_15]|nr:MAG: hypothetical protein A2X86_14395 [Bdellovibrionales bacterium GWA2_49_15]
MIDPYKILGVSKEATIDEIKKAYRKLAKKLHPDLNPGKDSERKFKDIAHAYDLIGTAEAKSKFDRGETDEQRQQEYEESMRANTRRAKRPSYHQTQQNTGRYSNVFDSDFNTQDIFEQFFGRAQETSKPGEDELYNLEIDFKEAALGSEKVITLPRGKKIKVQIPAGIEDGQKLRFKGLGGPGINNGPSGDAYVQISVKKLSGFTRAGQDILTTVPVSIFEAISGGEIEVPTIDGSVMLKIPPGVNNGSKLRISGKGVGVENYRGNQIVTINIVMPKQIDPAFKEAMLKLSNQFSYSARDAR